MHSIEWYRQRSMQYAISGGTPAKNKKSKRKKPKATRARWWSQYHSYIHSPEWRTFRLTIFATRGAKCERCGSVKHLELHHLNYRNLGHEKPADVLIVCHSCHKLAHPDKM